MIFATLAAAAALAQSPAAPAADFRARLPEDEVIYFLLPDRFDNGDARNDRGGLKGGPLQTGFDPTRKGFYQGGDLKGLVRRLDYLQGHGRHRHLVRAHLQEQAGAGREGPGERWLSRLLGHRLHSRRSAFWREWRLQDLCRRGACARHEGLHGHHHQPYGGRHQVRRMRGGECLPVSLDRRLSLPASRRHRRQADQSGLPRRDRPHAGEFRQADRSQLRLHAQHRCERAERQGSGLA